MPDNMGSRKIGVGRGWVRGGVSRRFGRGRGYEHERDGPIVAFKLSKRKDDDNLQMLHIILFRKKAKEEVTAKLLEFLESPHATIDVLLAVKEQAAEQDYEKEKLNKRIAKLSGGVAVIQTIEILFNKRIFLDMEVHNLAFYSDVLDSLAVELKASKDFSKLYAGIAILWLHLSLN
ncbi:hypothetical protein PVK06_043813 [Gossypium arboreum]|uniref:Uncharacterized protein n=1 Tax=Gossypium arboreum TaxID=29729 RepID=A0ABR0MPV3_GOSAR|nr:hypothetical protein PVK06_043813 [Gossypium arboreum]